MEMVNGDGNVYSTLHWMSCWPGKQCGDFDTYHKSRFASTRMPPTWSSGFDEYAVERSPEHVAYLIDGEVKINVTSDSLGAPLSHSPFFLILNTAIGGAWPGEPAPTTA